MSGFEKWQVVNLVVANVLLLGAVVGAWYVGLKQTSIARQQAEINRRLLELEYELSIDIDYDKERKVFILSNRSRHSVYFGGVRFGGTGPLETIPQAIPVGGKYEITRHQDYDQLAPSNGGWTEDVNFYLMDERREKFIVRAEVSTRNQNGKLSELRIRKTAPEKVKW
jgi:hypothetical protein